MYMFIYLQPPLIGITARMADDREPIAGDSSKKQKRSKPPKEQRPPRRYRDTNVYDDYDDDASKGRCTCRKQFFCSMEGILKLIEFVSF